MKSKSILIKHPELMTVICNIQNIQDFCSMPVKFSFNELELMTGDQLHEIQDNLIPAYNKAVAKRLAE